MKLFSGFPDGKLTVTPLPDLFFSELCPEIDDLAELQVTLHLFWRLAHRGNRTPYVPLADLKSDRTLARSLKSAGVKPEEGLARALARATERGTLLCLSVSSKKDPVGDTYYFMNSQAGRRALAQMERESPPADRARRPDPTDAAERPNVFELYEKSFGLLLTPVIADELKEAEREYPVEWIADALKEAALQGKRNWKYARRILERWKTEGRVDSKKGKPWYGDEYGKYIKR